VIKLTANSLTTEAEKSTMDASVDQVYFPDNLCQWIVHTQQHHLCLTHSNITTTRSITHRYNSLYGDAIEHSFATGSGVIGTLGGVLLILVIIAIISCIKEHKRIQLLSSSRLTNIQLSSLTATSDRSSTADRASEAEQCNEVHMEDNPPEYSTIVTIQEEEESPPTYIEALEKQKVCQ